MALKPRKPEKREEKFSPRPWETPTAKRLEKEVVVAGKIHYGGEELGNDATVWSVFLLYSVSYTPSLDSLHVMSCLINLITWISYVPEYTVWPS